MGCFRDGRGSFFHGAGRGVAGKGSESVGRGPRSGDPPPHHSAGRGGDPWNWSMSDCLSVITSKMIDITQIQRQIQ